MRWSPQLFRLLGLPPSAAAMTFEAYRAMLRPEDRLRTSAAVHQAIAERVPFSVVHGVTRRDGSPCWLQVSGEVHGGDGHPMQVVAFCQDVTAQCAATASATSVRHALELANEELQLQAEELRTQAAELSAQAAALEAQKCVQRAQILRLEEIDRYKDEFLAVLSHELRTPLHFILGFSTVLEDEVLGPVAPEQRDSLHRIVLGTERMLRLVDDLLEIARIRAGKVTFEPRHERLEPLAAQVLAGFELQAQAAGITLAAEVPGELVGWFDADRTTQVLANLVGNALKFTPPGGRVTVGASRRGRMLRVDVRDTGPGISAVDCERVFQKFEQLDMSATRPQGGVGLGLAIAKGLVTIQGGAIGVEGNPEVGACFWFTIPIDAGGATPA